MIVIVIGGCDSDTIVIVIVIAIVIGGCDSDSDRWL